MTFLGYHRIRKTKKAGSGILVIAQPFLLSPRSGFRRIHPVDEFGYDVEEGYAAAERGELVDSEDARSRLAAKKMTFQPRQAGSWTKSA
jgi:hypothetical protein